MIGMLRGKVWEIQLEKLVLDVQGVGYLLTVPVGMLTKLKGGQDLVVYTHVVLKEDELALYGFASQEEKQLFLEMLGVSGIGPKAAISILSTYGVIQIQSAIASENLNLLTKVPGIGKKTAQRLVLELKEKYKSSIGMTTEIKAEPLAAIGPRYSEATETLLALGFSLEEAQGALKRVVTDEVGTEEQVKLALRYFAGRRN